MLKYEIKIRGAVNTLVMMVSLGVCMHLFGMKNDGEITYFLWVPSADHSDIQTLASLPEKEQKHLRKLNVGENEDLIPIEVYDGTSRKWFNNVHLCRESTFSNYFPLRWLKDKREGEVFEAALMNGEQVAVRCQRKGVPEGFDEALPFEQVMAKYQIIVEKRSEQQSVMKKQPIGLKVQDATLVNNSRSLKKSVFTLQRILVTTIFASFLLWQCKKLCTINFSRLFRRIVKI